MSNEKTIAVVAICISILALFLSAHSPSPITQPDSTLKSDIPLIKERLAKLEKSYSEMDNNISSFQLSYYLAQNKYATFSPTEEKFQLLNTSYGNLLVALRNAEKLGNGYKLTFDFGNPTSISISGLKGKIKWRPATDWVRYYKDKDYQKEVDGKKTQEKDFDILSDLYPGSWNRVSITIGPASEEEIGQITLSDILASSVRMRIVNLPN